MNLKASALLLQYFRLYLVESLRSASLLFLELFFVIIMLNRINRACERLNSNMPVLVCPLLQIPGVDALLSYNIAMVDFWQSKFKADRVVIRQLCYFTPWFQPFFICKERLRLGLAIHLHSFIFPWEYLEDIVEALPAAKVIPVG